MRLGIDAPQEVPVHRQEVYEAIQRENGQSLARPAGNKKPEFVAEERDTPDYKGMIEQIRRIIMSN